MAGVRFNKSQADRIAAAVRGFERAGTSTISKRTDQRWPEESFYAKITDANGTGDYSWRRQTLEGPGDLVNDFEEIEGEFTASEINFLVPDTDSIVLLTFAGYDEDDEPRYIFSIGWRKQGFNVYVTKDGGSGGSNVAPCTWTYTVKDAWGNTLATTKAPELWRPAAGAFVFAPNGSRAIAYRTGLTAGDLTLWQVNEVPDTEACAGGG